MTVREKTVKRKRLLIESSTISLVKSWDAIIIGGGIIGLSLAISLRKQGLRVLIVERGEPGREASYAAAGMLAGSGLEIPVPLRPLAEESARLYPEFVLGEIGGRLLKTRRNLPRFDSGDDLVKKTPMFYQGATKRLDLQLARAYEYDSKHFGVIDTFGWFCLFNEADVQITRFRQWEEYLTVIRELAGTHRLECREIDAALWYAGTTRRDFAMANQ